MYEKKTLPPSLAMLLCLCSRFAFSLVTLGAVFSPGTVSVSNATVQDPVTSERTLVALQELVNPHGSHFHTLPVDILPSPVTAYGQPETSHSWFPGFAWRMLTIALCVTACACLSVVFVSVSRSCLVPCHHSNDPLRCRQSRLPSTSGLAI